MEKALLHILRRNHFTGSEDVSVFVVGPAPTPIYILTFGGDVAKVLGDLLLPILGKRIQSSPMEWVLFRTDAEAILEAAKVAP